MEEKVDLNKASDTDVMNIRGISDAVALQIIYYRNKQGPIRQWEDLENLPGMTQAILDTLRERATLGA